MFPHERLSNYPLLIACQQNDGQYSTAKVEHPEDLPVGIPFRVLICQFDGTIENGRVKVA